MSTSRIAGFYQLSVEERRTRLLKELKELEQTDERELDTSLSNAIETWESGGLSVKTASQIVENVLGTYALPFGVALNGQLNGIDRLIPMVVEEPSVIAAASNACRMIRAGGGFVASMKGSLMIAQIELRDVPDTQEASRTLLARKAELIQAAALALPGLVRRGGGPQDLEVRTIGPQHLVVHLLVDCRDAMGANLVNSAAEKIGPLVAQIAGARLGLRILSNLADRRIAHVEGRIPTLSLLSKQASLDPSLRSFKAKEIADGIEAACIFAERDPYRAATHNKGIMNGIDSVVIATGNDYRAVEAGAHAYAARSGTYSPLCTWRRQGDQLVGKLALPLALGIVGGTLRVHQGARLALAISQATSADDLALLAACAGMASNLAALRALATEGIQRGHMSLHARSVAIAAGANEAEVEEVATTIAAAGIVTLHAAKDALSALRLCRE